MELPRARVFEAFAFGDDLAVADQSVLECEIPAGLHGLDEQFDHGHVEAFQLMKVDDGLDDAAVDGLGDLGFEVIGDFADHGLRGVLGRRMMKTSPSRLK